jgi:hypothetical protein
LRFRRWSSFVGSTLVAATLVACTGGASTSSPSTGATGVPTTRPSSTAQLKIMSPTTGEVLPAGDITLRLKLTGAKVVAPTSLNLVPNEGHLHVILDNQLISMTATTTTTLPNVAPGTHLLKVEFVANDHAPFDPRVIAATSFTVKG